VRLEHAATARSARTSALLTEEETLVYLREARLIGNGCRSVTHLGTSETLTFEAFPCAGAEHTTCLSRGVKIPLTLASGALGACLAACSPGGAPHPTPEEGGGSFDATSEDARHRDAATVRETGAGDAADAGSCSPIDAGEAAARFEPSLPPHPDRLLFVGNSFTYVNDLPGTFQSMVKAWAPSVQSPYVNSFTVGGGSFSADVDGIEDGGGPLGALLGVGDAGRAVWTDVMLQEQSEIPGFPLDDSERITSMTSVVTLAGYAVADHATPTLVMTWGYRDGDPANPGLYPDFLTMEGLLETGYREMAHAVAEAGHPVLVAPVGPAFKAIYDVDVAAGRTPTDPSSLFFSLYQSDGKHPAPPATYLMGLVLMSTLYGVDPGAVCANPGLLAPAEEATFRAAARSAVVAERAFQPYLHFDGGCEPCPACGTTPAPACCGPISPCPP
jgi:hypothetical protein